MKSLLKLLEIISALEIEIQKSTTGNLLDMEERKMKRHLYSVLAISFFVTMIMGCVTAKVAPNAANLQVDYSWTKANSCSSVSPPIKVSGIPTTTRELKVTLTDFDAPNYNHGGGTVKYEGSDTIPAGALKNYTGPCPPSGTHSYAIKVDAVDAAGVIVGRGQRTLPCCP